MNLCVCVCVLSGFLTEDSYDFANSWAVKGAGQTCRRVSDPSPSCNSTKATSTVRHTNRACSRMHRVF